MLYFDYAAATPLDPRVAALVTRLERTTFGNASSVHSFGQKAVKIIEDSRHAIAQVLRTQAQAIVFTGSGTEANNLAVFGSARARRDLGKHIIISAIEHHSVLRPAQALVREGFEVTSIVPKPNGVIDPADVARAIRPDTILVSIGYANNEIGTIQPISEIASALKANTFNLKPIFHTDACQAAGFLDLDVHRLGVDLMTLSAVKAYGPKGIGFLFVKSGVMLDPIIMGGDQERGLRAGTQNSALVAGFALALDIAEKKRKTETPRLTALRDYAISKIKTLIPGTSINGDEKHRLPNNINVSFEGVDGEMLMLALDAKGIAVSTGAACTISSNEPSHVLQALGATRSSIRISLGRPTKKADIDKLIKVLSSEVVRLRKIG